jgi:hypothetical protein
VIRLSKIKDVLRDRRDLTKRDNLKRQLEDLARTAEKALRQV